MEEYDAIRNSSTAAVFGEVDESKAPLAELDDFLRNRKKGKELLQRPTFHGIPGTYYVAEDEIPRLFSICSSVVNEGSALMPLLEVPGEYSRYWIDLDIYAPRESKMRKVYGAQHITSIIEVIGRQFFELFEIDEFTAAILEKKPRKKEKVTRKKGGEKITEQRVYNSVHIIFLGLSMSKALRVHISRACGEMINKKFESVSDGNVFDKMVDANDAFVYGSAKANAKSFSLTYLYRCYQKIQGKGIVVESIKEDEWDGEIEVDNLCWALRINADEHPKFKNEIYGRQIESDYKKEKEAGCTKFSEEKLGPDGVYRKHLVESAVKLVSMLSPDRSAKGHYEEWIQLGMALKGICDCESLLKAWIEFSKLSPEAFVPGECERMWKNNFNKKGYGYGSLVYWAKHDNPNEYDAWKKSDLLATIGSNPMLQNFDIARILRNRYTDQFIYEPFEKKWYTYEGFLWRRCELPYPARMSLVMSEELYELCETIQKRARDQKQFEEDKEDDKKDEKKKKRVRGFDIRIFELAKTMSALKQNTFKKQCVAEAAILMGIDDLMDTFDTNMKEICARNGVIDLDDISAGARRVFTRSRHTKMMSVEYITNDQILSEKKFLEGRLAETYPDPEIRTCSLCTMASALAGNREQHFVIFRGSGANSKSTWLQLFKNVLGDYATSMSVNVILDNKHTVNAQGPSPYIVMMKGMRATILSEIKKNRKIDIDLLKWLTGGAEISARRLNENPISFRVLCKIFLDSNYPPCLLGCNDYGSIRRIFMIPHESKFIDKAKTLIDPLDPSKGYRKLAKNEFYADPDLIHRRISTDTTKIAFLHILLDHYKIYRDLGHIPVPKSISDYNDSFIQTLDTVFKFIKEALSYTGNHDDTIKLMPLYTAYKEWYTSEYGSAQRDNIMSQFEFKENIELKKEYDKEIKGLRCHKLL